MFGFIPNRQRNENFHITLQKVKRELRVNINPVLYKVKITGNDNFT